MAAVMAKLTLIVTEIHGFHDGTRHANWEAAIG
jgi:hypothetical protein